MRSITALPNLLTLANAFCGLLALSKGIDALALSATEPALFYAKFESACWLVILGGVFDALDGRVARMTGGSSAFGAQLDSFSDALTFGAAPALLAKVLLEHEGLLTGAPGNPRLHFVAVAIFTLMAILRLARFNLETDSDEASHRDFRGLPSPAAAGAVISTLLFYLSMLRPEQLEVDDGTPTPFGSALALFPELHFQVPSWFLPAFAVYLALLGFLMVSDVRYVHVMSVVTRRGSFTSFVLIVLACVFFFAAPIPVMFLATNIFVAVGVVRHFRRRRQPPAQEQSISHEEFTESMRS